MSPDDILIRELELFDPAGTESGRIRAAQTAGSVGVRVAAVAQRNFCEEQQMATDDAVNTGRFLALMITDAYPV